MPTLKRKTNFFDTEEGIEIKNALIDMAKDENYKTDSSYSANVTNYPDNLIPFVDKHMNYLMQHQNLNPHHYIANLRLMTKIK